MEANSSPLPPLGAVRTVYPKLSRNAFSQSSKSWLSSMQRTIWLRGFIWTGSACPTHHPQCHDFDLVKLFEIAHTRFPGAAVSADHFFTNDYVSRSHSWSMNGH